MIEKAIAAALEPFADSLVAAENTVKELRAKLDAMQKQIDAPIKYEINLDEVAADLMLRGDLMQAIKGAPGSDGKDGAPGMHGKDGAPGQDGKDGAPGMDGAPGKDGAPGQDGAKGFDGIGCNAPMWKPGIYREGNLVQHDLGCIYLSKCDTVQEPGGDDWQRLGTLGFRWCGLKQEGREYVDGDLFIDAGTTFLQANGKANMFAKRGRDGTNGRDGKDGADAPQLIDAHFLDECKTLALVLSDGRMLEVPLPPLFYQAVIETPSVKALRDEVTELRGIVKTLTEKKGAKNGN